MSKAFLTMLVAAVSITACAKTPSNIAPVAVASSEYSSYSCKKLAKLKIENQTALEKSSKIQRQKVAGDAATVFLVLVPVSKLAGDEEGTIGQLKGEAIAIDRAREKKRCA
jgi:hypothetical protein